MRQAALKGSHRVCEWLLSKEKGGGRLGEWQLQADRDGNTPASMARAEGHTELARWLEEKVLNPRSGVRVGPEICGK